MCVSSGHFSSFTSSCLADRFSSGFYPNFALRNLPANGGGNRKAPGQGFLSLVSFPEPLKLSWLFNFKIYLEGNMRSFGHTTFRTDFNVNTSLETQARLTVMTTHALQFCSTSFDRWVALCSWIKQAGHSADRHGLIWFIWGYTRRYKLQVVVTHQPRKQKTLVMTKHARSCLLLLIDKSSFLLSIQQADFLLIGMIWKGYLSFPRGTSKLDL